MKDVNFAVAIVRETGSTNDDIEALVNSDIIKPEALANFHGYTEIALSQTGGRGRFERIWDSAYGGLYQSTLLFMDMLAGINFSMLTVLTAVSVLQALDRFAPGAAAAVKWPNDIVAGGGKLCGILMKALPGRPGAPVVIGVGVNVFNRVDESKLRKANTLPPAVLCELTAKSYGESDVTALSEEILSALGRNLHKASGGDYGAIFSEYSSRLLYKNEKVVLYDRVEAGRIAAEGVFEGIDENGFILIRDEMTGGTKAYPSGEIKIL